MKYILLAYTNREAWDAATAEMQETQQLPASILKACEFYEQFGKGSWSSPASSSAPRGWPTRRNPRLYATTAVSRSRPTDLLPSPRKFWSASALSTAPATTGQSRLPPK
jgi:hypothetical protein